jgi:hypothetical protein
MVSLERTYKPSGSIKADASVDQMSNTLAS